jgi:uncharacterized SAM-binding protein YcdF (DUF218 family)
MKKLIVIVVLLVLTVRIHIVRDFLLTQAGAFLIYQDHIEAADAVLILGGGKKERVQQGIELVNKKYSGWMIFTGDYIDPIFAENTHWALEAQKLAVHEGLKKDMLIPILNSQSTRDDAELAKEVCLKKHFKSLIVISEPYHTRRAHYVFDKVYKKSGIKIIIYPVQNSWYKSDTWWKSKTGYWDTNIEYQKMLYYLIKGYLF